MLCIRIACCTKSVFSIVQKSDRKQCFAIRLNQISRRDVSKIPWRAGLRSKMHTVIWLANEPTETSRILNCIARPASAWQHAICNCWHHFACNTRVAHLLKWFCTSSAWFCTCLFLFTITKDLLHGSVVFCVLAGASSSLVFDWDRRNGVRAPPNTLSRCSGDPHPSNFAFSDCYAGSLSSGRSWSVVQQTSNAHESDMMQSTGRFGFK